jgi:hypothetical protein
MTGKRGNYDDVLRLRLSTDLGEKARQCAEAAGVSVSEFLRGVVTEHLRKVVPADRARLWEKDTPFRRAAHGDLAAQRLLMNDYLMVAYQEPDRARWALDQAEHYARMCALNGEDIDRKTVVQVLALIADHAQTVGDHGLRQEKLSEIVAILSVLADDGDEFAARSLNDFVALGDGSVMGVARSHVAAWELA